VVLAVVVQEIVVPQEVLVHLGKETRVVLALEVLGAVGEVAGHLPLEITPPQVLAG
jgi:hypothetical protein